MGADDTDGLHVASRERVELGESHCHIATSGIVGEHLLEQRDRGGAGVAGGLGVGEGHHDLVAQCEQPPSGGVDERAVDVHEGELPAPLGEGERVLAGSVGWRQIAGAGDELLETGGVEQIERALQPIATAGVLDGETAVERLADGADLGLEAATRPRGVLAPHAVQECVRRHDRTGRGSNDREQFATLGAERHFLAGGVSDTDLTEHADRGTHQAAVVDHRDPPPVRFM